MRKYKSLPGESGFRFQLTAQQLNLQCTLICFAFAFAEIYGWKNFFSFSIKECGFQLKSQTNLELLSNGFDSLHCYWFKTP